jgi:hypothetical protein
MENRAGMELQVLMDHQAWMELLGVQENQVLQESFPTLN